MRPTRALALLWLAAVAAAGCAAGAADVPGGPDAPEGTLAVIARDDLTFAPDTLTAPAGEVTVQLTCEDAVNHNLVIEELDLEVAACAPGRTATGTVVLDPGTYVVVCTVPGHEPTMRGALTVTP